MPKKPVPQKKPSRLTPHLESSVVAAKDLRDQPASKFVLIVGNSTERKPNYYAVDSYSLLDPLVVFRNKANQAVFIARADGAWSLVSRAAVNIVTERELMIFSKEDVAVRNAFYKELDPAAFAAAEDEVMSPKTIGIPLSALLGGGGGHEHAPKEPDNKPTPGQYI